MMGTRVQMMAILTATVLAVWGGAARTCLGDLGPRQVIATTGAAVKDVGSIMRLDSAQIDLATEQIWITASVMPAHGRGYRDGVCRWTGKDLEACWVPGLIVPPGISTTATGYSALRDPGVCAGRFAVATYQKSVCSWWVVGDKSSQKIGDSETPLPGLRDPRFGVDQNSVQCVGIDPHGRLTFVAVVVERDNLSENRALWWGEPGALVLVAPDMNGAEPSTSAADRGFSILRISEVVSTRTGEVWFSGLIEQDGVTREALLHAIDGKPRVALLGGQPAPGFEDGWEIEGVAWTAPNTAGAAAFIARCFKPIPGETSGYGSHAGYVLVHGKLQLLFREGVEPPDWDRPETLYANGNYGTPALRMTASGLVAWIAETRQVQHRAGSPGGMVVCLFDKGLTKAVLRTGQSVPGLPPDSTPHSFYNLAMNDAGQMVVYAGNARGGSVLARRRNGEWVALASTGDRMNVPGLGERDVKEVSLVCGTGGETLCPTSLGPGGLVVYMVTFEAQGGEGGSLPDAAIFAQQLD